MALGRGLEAAGQQAGVASTGNKVELRLTSTRKWVPCQVGDMLTPGDTIRTGPKSSASLLLSDQTMMRLGENTEITLVSMSDKGSLTEKFLLAGGRAWAKVTPGNHLQLEGPNAVAAVKGTVLEMDCLDRRMTRVRVWEGRVECLARKKNYGLSAGHGLVCDGREPRLEICALDPRDQFQQWNVAFDQKLEVAFLEGADSSSQLKDSPPSPGVRATVATVPGESGGGGGRTKKRRITLTSAFLKQFASKHAVKP